jgi:AraC-like DNA-binding protein
MNVPAGGITSLLLPLQHCEAFSVFPAAMQESIPLEVPYIHGQFTQCNMGNIQSVHHHQPLALFGIVFTPSGLQRFLYKQLGRMDAIQNMFMKADSFLPDIRFLQEELQEHYVQHRLLLKKQEVDDSTPYCSLNTMQELAHLAEKFLLRFLSSAKVSESLVKTRRVENAEYICRHLTQTHGRASIHEVSHELGLSERQSLRIMQEYIGVSGKTFGEIQRYLYASRLLLHSAPQLVSEEGIHSQLLHTIIHEAGYFDQSHCIRDFKRFSGATPLQFLKNHHALAEKIIGADTSE